MKKIDENYIKELKDYLLKAEERLLYSLKRFDVLIISLSSGGLVLAMSIFKSFNANTIAIDKDYISNAWIAFSVALISNLVSQITGYLANKYDIKFTKNIINKFEKKEQIGNQKMNGRLQSIFDYLTAGFNILSFISLVLGIIYLTLIHK